MRTVSDLHEFPQIGDFIVENPSIETDREIKFIQGELAIVSGNYDLALYYFEELSLNGDFKAIFFREYCKIMNLFSSGQPSEDLYFEFLFEMLKAYSSFFQSNYIKFIVDVLDLAFNIGYLENTSINNINKLFNLGEVAFIIESIVDCPKGSLHKDLLVNLYQELKLFPRI